ncbi:methionine ABC transporter permease [Lagierella massiliensis]|uniref:methionine ABC transporter permease n=1 Tax=Lagierella massiliensis TaxID=1689303 RepID=UPI0006D78AC5|nr:methionine ABC transporter permease [Lagierella massiliensis]
MSFKEILDLVVPETFTTLYMVFATALISIAIGLPLGIVLMISRPGGIKEMPKLYKVLDVIINIFRSIPFVILILLVIPLARLLIGRSTGTQASILSLSIATIPFVARLMEGYFLSIDKGLIEAAQAMGSTNGQIVKKVIIPESMPLVISGITMTIINIVGYSAMVGILGGGGLGQLAYRYGYQRRMYNVLLASVFVIIVIVQIVQLLGSFISKKIDKK